MRRPRWTSSSFEVYRFSYLYRSEFLPFISPDRTSQSRPLGGGCEGRPIGENLQRYVRIQMIFPQNMGPGSDRTFLVLDNLIRPFLASASPNFMGFSIENAPSQEN